MRPVRKVLIHARGCTAAKLIRIAQQQDIQVILVQSDPDMESAAVDQLTDNDTLVCIGGNTPDESYLNAQSVLNVAENQGADSLHPGIGFCRKTQALQNWFALTALTLSGRLLPAWKPWATSPTPSIPRCV